MEVFFKYCKNIKQIKLNILGFYRGMSVLVVLSIPKTASRFGANEYLKNNVFKVHILFIKKKLKNLKKK